jgi:hypothetical protein
LQLDAVPLSARKRYTVSPLGSTRTCPSFELPTLIAVPVAAGGAGGRLGTATGTAPGAELGGGFVDP